jgi:hypothetical protein
MWTKFISNIVGIGIGIVSGCILATSSPIQAQILIPGNNLSGNLNYNYDNPIVPITNRFTGLDINSFNLEPELGRISNFQGTSQLKEVSNLIGLFLNGQATIDSLSGLITGGRIDTNLLRNLAQSNGVNFGTDLTNLGVLSNLGRTATEQFSLPQLGFNSQIMQTLTNNPNYGRLVSPSLTTIPGLPSRIYPGLGLTAPSR